MALWYKNSGPWWDSTNLKPNDGISLAEEKNDANSLYNFYKKMIALHKTNKTIAYGSYTTINNNADSVLTFLRTYKNEKVLVAVNLSSAPLHVTIDAGINNLVINSIKPLFGNSKTDNHQFISFELKPFDVTVWSIN